MSRATRLAAGWSIAIAAALFLNLLLTAPISAPEPVVLAGASSPTPTAVAAADYSDDALPPFPHWPPPGSRAGSARPASLVALAAEDGAALQAAADRAREEFGLQSLALGVSVRGRLAWAGASGVARDGTTSLGGDSPYGIASITKTFTAALVLQLVEDERLSLDDQVAALMPEAGVAAGVTVRQLLSHTSGIADLLAPMRDPMNADPDRLWTAAEVVARIGGPWFAPGVDYGYSNSNYVLLGMLVERISGRPFAEELSRRLLGPLDLDETGILTAPEAPALMTPSWASAFGTSGYMYSSASDLIEWADALYGGRVLDRETLATMLTFSDDDYGLGVERIELGTRSGYGHSGLLRGFTSLLVHLPADDVTLVIIGSWQGFDPGSALTWKEDGRPSIVDVALGIAD